MELVYDRFHQKVCVCVDCHSGITVPQSAWTVARIKRQAKRTAKACVRPPDDLTAWHHAKVVESSDDAIISKDLNSTIISWNPAAERMFGYTEQEAIGKSIRMLIPAHLQSEEDHVLSKIRAGDKVDHYETIRQRKDGSLIM